VTPGTDNTTAIIQALTSLPTQTLLAVMIFRIYTDAIKGVVWLQGIVERLLNATLSEAIKEGQPAAVSHQLSGTD